jgi:hypothetical protein
MPLVTPDILLTDTKFFQLSNKLSRLGLGNIIMSGSEAQTKIKMKRQHCQNTKPKQGQRKRI